MIYLWRQRRSERQKSFLTFNILFDILIFDVLINLFIFDVLINLKNTFDVLTLRRSDFQRSDPLSSKLGQKSQKQYFNFFYSITKTQIMVAVNNQTQIQKFKADIGVTQFLFKKNYSQIKTALYFLRIKHNMFQFAYIFSKIHNSKISTIQQLSVLNTFTLIGWIIKIKSGPFGYLSVNVLVIV